MTKHRSICINISKFYISNRIQISGNRSKLDIQMNRRRDAIKAHKCMSLLNRHGDGPMLESTTLTANNDEEEPESESDDDNDA